MSKKQFVAVLMVLMLLPVVSGCANTMNAIENRDLSLTAKMSDTIFLDPDVVSENHKVYVRTTNTSDLQEINFTELLKAKLVAHGFTVVNSTKDAYTVQANLLYMGKDKQGLTAETALAGGFGGALAGAAIGRSYTGAAIGGLAGSLIGAGIGMAFHVDSYFGACDVQIKEPTGPVSRHIMADVRQGSSTTVTSESHDVVYKQEYRTRIVVFARQTNIDVHEACDKVADRLASQIAGIF